MAGFLRAGSAVRVSRIRMRLPKGMNQREWGTDEPRLDGSLDTQDRRREWREQVRGGDQVPAKPALELRDHPPESLLDGQPVEPGDVLLRVVHVGEAVQAQLEQRARRSGSSAWRG